MRRRCADVVLPLNDSVMAKNAGMCVGGTQARRTNRRSGFLFGGSHGVCAAICAMDGSQPRHSGSPIQRGALLAIPSLAMRHTEGFRRPLVLLPIRRRAYLTTPETREPARDHQSTA